MGNERTLYITRDDIHKPDMTPVRRLTPDEHERALPAAKAVQEEAERLLDDEDTGYFLDSEGNKIHIRNGPALDDRLTDRATLQIDTWINRNVGRKIASRSMQVYTFHPDGTVIQTSNDRTLIHDATKDPTWHPHSKKHEADYIELTRLRRTLQESTSETAK